MIKPGNIDLEELIIAWRGLPSAPREGPAFENGWLPAALREWYAVSARWAQPLMKFMRMYPANQIGRSGNKGIFMEDSEGDWLWAFDDAESLFETELHGNWHVVAESLSDFLVHCFVIDGAIAAKFWRESRRVDSDLLDLILAPMSEISFANLQWPTWWEGFHLCRYDSNRAAGCGEASFERIFRVCRGSSGRSRIKSTSLSRRNKSVTWWHPRMG